MRAAKPSVFSATAGSKPYRYNDDLIWVTDAGILYGFMVGREPFGFLRLLRIEGVQGAGQKWRSAPLIPAP